MSFYDSDDDFFGDDLFAVTGGGKESRKNYIRELTKNNGIINRYEKSPTTTTIGGGNERGDCWRKSEKTPEEIRNSNAMYSPAHLFDDTDDGENSSKTTTSSSSPNSSAPSSPGKNFDRIFNVEIIGSRISEKFVYESFEQAFHQKKILGNLKWAKYETPTTIQRYAMAYIKRLRDVVACSPTGSGKTAAYLLPIMAYILERGDVNWTHNGHPAPCAIVVAPTHELVAQITDEANKYAWDTKIQIVGIYGGTNWRRMVEYIRRNGCNILIGTPGRLLQLLNEGRLHLGKCKYVVLDDPQSILANGNDDMSIQRILTYPGLPDRGHIRNTLIFSATFPDELRRLAREFLYDYVFVSVGKTGGANEDISQSFLRVPQSEKLENLYALLGINDDTNDNGATTMLKTIIFVERGAMVAYIGAQLQSKMGLRAAVISGFLEQRDRECALRDFKSGRCPILVSTGVSARGLDIACVDHVINFDMPSTADEYVHRIGRTGRIGNIGRATSFFDPKTDQALVNPLLKLLRDAGQKIPDWLEKEAEGNYCGGENGGGRGLINEKKTRKVANNYFRRAEE